MNLSKKPLADKVDALFTDVVTEYKTENVPDTSFPRLTYGNTGYRGAFTFLYVDIRGSSTFTEQHRLQTIAKIYKAFHHCMVKAIKNGEGEVRSFDGDRVMAVFAGERKRNNAVETAKLMEGCVIEILQPKINSKYHNDSFEIGIGIATGECMVIKAGAGRDENTNDLVWIGEAPNLGAKLSDHADFPYRVWIDQRTFNGLRKKNLFYKNKDETVVSKWKEDEMEFAGEDIEVYKSRWYSPLS